MYKRHVVFQANTCEVCNRLGVYFPCGDTTLRRFGGINICKCGGIENYFNLRPVKIFNRITVCDIKLGYIGKSAIGILRA